MKTKEELIEYYQKLKIAKKECRVNIVAMEQGFINQPTNIRIEAVKMQMQLEKEYHAMGEMIRLLDWILEDTPCVIREENSERAMFEKSFQRPSNFFELSNIEQYNIDKRLGLLNWKGEGLTLEDMARFNQHYRNGKNQIKKG